MAVARTESSLGEDVRRGALWSALGNVGFRLLGVATTAIVARILTPHEFGVFAVALVVFSVIASMGELGFGAYLMRAGVDVERVAPSVSTMCTLIGAVLAIVMFCTAVPLSHALGEPAAAGPVRILSLCVFMVGYFAVPVALVSRAFRQDRMFVAYTVSFVPGTAVLLGGAAIGLGAESFAWSRVVGSLVTGAVISHYAPQRWGFSSRYLRELLRFGLPLTGANLFNLVLLNVDFMIIANRLGATELGIYSVAFNLSALAMSLISSIVLGVAMPAFARVGTDPEQLAQTVHRIVQFIGVVTIAMSALMSAVAAPLVEVVYGRQWLSAIAVLQIMPIFGACNVLVLLLTNLLAALGHSRALLALQGGWLILLAPALLEGVARWGIVGAGWAHVAVMAFAVVPAFIAVVARKRICAPGTFGRALAGPLAAGAVMWVVARCICLMPGPRLLVLVIAGGVATCVYLAMTWRIVQPQLLRIAPGRLNRLVRLVPGSASDA